LSAEITASEELEGGIGKHCLQFEEATLAQSPELLKILSNENSFSLVSLAPRQPDMEEIFLAATKRSWEEPVEKSRLPAKAQPPSA
jgi:ABC-2 type transport system ATP-binding protein